MLKFLKRIIVWFYSNFVIDIIAITPTIIGVKLRFLYLKIFARRCGKNFVSHSRTFFYYPHNLNIGNNVSLSGNCILNANSLITIKDNVMIGPNCNIMTANHGFSDKNIPMNAQPSKSNELTINEDVWIGNGVVINSGSRKIEIAKGVVIASNSVITKSIDLEYTIWGGVPARLIKGRFE